MKCHTIEKVIQSLIYTSLALKMFIKMESLAEPAVKLEIYPVTRKLVLDLQTGTLRKMQLYFANYRILFCLRL